MILFLLFPLASGISPEYAYAVHSMGGLSGYKSAYSSDLLNQVSEFTNIDKSIFERIKFVIIPSLLADENFDTTAKIVDECVETLVEFPYMKSFIWCSIALSSNSDLYYNYSLNDAGFSDLIVYPSRIKWSSFFAPPTPFQDLRIFEFPDFVSESTKSTQISISDYFKNARRIKTGFGYVGLSCGHVESDSISARIYAFVNSIEAGKRLWIMSEIFKITSRRGLHALVKSIVDPTEKIYAKYISSFLYLNESVVRVLAAVSTGFGTAVIPFQITAENIARMLYEKNPNFSYITSDHILEWYSMLTKSKSTRLYGLSGDTEYPDWFPTIHISLVAWKESFLAPRIRRLETTGNEIMINVG